MSQITPLIKSYTVSAFKFYTEVVKGTLPLRSCVGSNPDNYPIPPVSTTPTKTNTLHYAKGGMPEALRSQSRLCPFTDDIATLRAGLGSSPNQNQTKNRTKTQKKKANKTKQNRTKQEKDRYGNFSNVQQFYHFLCFASFVIILLSGINYFLSGYMKYIYICTIFFVIFIITLACQCLV